MKRELRNSMFLGFGACAVMLLALGWLQWRYQPLLNSALPSCRDNLCHIDWAKDDWAAKNRLTNGDAEPKAADLFGRKRFTSVTPQCPQGGTYTIGKLSEKPRCSLPEHASNYGDMQVSDEWGRALAGATVQVRSELSNAVPWEFRSTVTGTDGVAHVCFNLLRADDLAAFKEGYMTSSMAIPQGWQWPAKLVLKKVPQ